MLEIFERRISRFQVVNTHLGTAIAIPVINPVMSPRELISSFGQFSPKDQDEANPMIAPIKIAIDKAPTSTKAEDLASFQSRTRVPNVIPMTGPIIGETNILATMTTVESTINPIPARILAMIKSAKKSKLIAFRANRKTNVSKTKISSRIPFRFIVETHCLFFDLFLNLFNS